MTKYKIIIEKSAEKDLNDIIVYIGEILHEPDIAMKIYFSIKIKILSLKELPLRYALIKDEPYCSMGVRRIPAENYTVFYVVDEAGRTVHIFRILHIRREWKSLL
ncbi:MAG: type II toxin-antitoxin system RelE/ParE family toxin [Clostridia bacterium]|nr:type II toxin-antitoxin system RelE/ParE family toxin [Clostridia bacterium]